MTMTCVDCGITLTPSTHKGKVPAGTRKHSARGLCSRDYIRRRTAGALDEHRPTVHSGHFGWCMTCGRDFTPERPHAARGLCHRDYRKLRARATYTPIRPYTPVEESEAVRPGFDVEQARNSLSAWQSKRKQYAHG